MNDKPNTKKKTTSAKKAPAKKTTTASAKKTTVTKKVSKPSTTAKKPAVKKAPAKKTTVASTKKAPVKKVSNPAVKTVEPKASSVIKKEEKVVESANKKTERIFNIYFFQGIVCSIVALMVGVFLISKPALATRTAEIITSVILILIGIASAFSNSLKSKVRFVNYDIIFGILAIILGVLIAMNPFVLSNFLTISFGIFLLLNGLLKGYYALSLKKINEECWTLILTMGIINAIFGIVIICNPFANLYFTQVVGMFMILYSIIEFTHMVLLRQRSKSILKLLK